MGQSRHIVKRIYKSRGESKGKCFVPGKKRPKSQESVYRLVQCIVEENSASTTVDGNYTKFREVPPDWVDTRCSE